MVRRLVSSDVAVVHASDREVHDAAAARVVDAIMGAGASVDIGTPEEASVSLYKELFGDAYLGRPRSDLDPPVASYPSGNRAVTATARRRAMRVLRQVYGREFETIMAYEVYYLLQHPEEVRSG